MKHIAYTLLLFTACILPLFSAGWTGLLQKHRTAMGDEVYALLSRQYAAHVAGSAPVIADPAIKEIPIKECGELLVNVNSHEQPRIKTMEGAELLKAHTAPEDIDPRAPAHAMVRQAVFDALVRMIVELDQLACEFGYAPGELEIHTRALDGWCD